MIRWLAPLAWLALACHPIMMRDASIGQSYVQSATGYCGALPVSPTSIITPEHCTSNPPLAYVDGNGTHEVAVTRCDTMADMCSLSLVSDTYEIREHASAMRLPRKGELVLVQSIMGNGAGEVLDTSNRWGQTKVDFACTYGDSGATVYSMQGVPLCMVTSCARINCGPAYCSNLVGFQ